MIYLVIVIMGLVYLAILMWSALTIFTLLALTLKWAITKLKGDRK